MADDVEHSSIFFDWDILDHDDHEGWDQLRCLYAYCSRDREILYIGKCWGTTVRQRWQFESKPEFWSDLETQRRIFSHMVLVGTVALYPGQRLTHQLLFDAESLLIHRLQPRGNIQSRLSRIERPGLVVHCRGDWLERQRRFHDAA